MAASNSTCYCRRRTRAGSCWSRRGATKRRSTCMRNCRGWRRMRKLTGLGLSAARRRAAPRISAAARLQGPGWTLIRQHPKIGLVQLRRQRPDIESSTAGGSFEPAAPPQDLEIGLRPRCELDRVLLDGLPSGQTVALHREGISARRKIAIKGDSRYAPTDLIAIGVDYRIAELFLRVLGPQKPHPRRPRRERRGWGVSLEPAARGRAGKQRQDAES